MEAKNKKERNNNNNTIKYPCCSHFRHHSRRILYVYFWKYDDFVGYIIELYELRM